MLKDDAAKAGEGLEALNLADVMRECLPGALVAIDPQKGVSGFNPAAEKLLGLQASQILRHSFEVLPVGLRAVIDQTFADGKPRACEISLCVGGGPERAIHVGTSIMVAARGESFGVIAVLHDLTPARTLEQQMKHLDRLASIGTLSASMAHEIKNALVAIKAFVELLIEKNKESELATMVSKEMRRIDSIVSQMLRFAGPAKPTFSRLHLHEVVKHSLGLMEHQLAGKKIQVKKSLRASPDWVRGDSYQLEQALLNLFFNAVEAMGPNGQLSIATELVLEDSASAAAPSQNLPASQLRLTIKDNGSGIPPENLPRLFDPFFTTKKKGNGLGLSITRRIIQEHGGAISVESALNQGTTFTLLLPCAAKS